MTNLLITGATGFVGSHLVESAQRQGFNVFALVRKSSDTKHLKSLGITCLEAELRDRSALENVFQNFKNKNIEFQSVIHCGALTKAKNYEQFLDVNVNSTALLIELIQTYLSRSTRFIFLSSLAACGPSVIGKKISLDDRNPLTGYGQSKLLAESKVKASGLPYIILRPTAVYGPKEKDIFTIFKMISQGVYPMIGRHEQQLTFIYVKDLVEMILEAVKVPTLNKTYFVTDGEIYSKQAIGDYIKKHLDRKVVKFTIPLGIVKVIAASSQFFFGLRNKLAPLNNEKYKELKAESWDCDINETKLTFKHIPKYNLDAGVAETTAWYRQEGWIS